MISNFSHFFNFISIYGSGRISNKYFQTYLYSGPMPTREEIEAMLVGLASGVYDADLLVNSLESSGRTRLVGTNYLINSSESNMAKFHKESIRFPLSSQEYEAVIFDDTGKTATWAIVELTDSGTPADGTRQGYWAMVGSVGLEGSGADFIVSNNVINSDTIFVANDIIIDLTGA